VIILPPYARKAMRSGSSVPITAWNFACDCRNPVSKLAVVSVVQSKRGFCLIQRLQ